MPTTDDRILYPKPTANPERQTVVIGETPTHFVEVAQQIFNGLLVTTPKRDTSGWDDGWTYPTPGEAMVAGLDWLAGTDAEPAGWTRHQPSNRRREGGDPAREEVRP